MKNLSIVLVAALALAAVGCKKKGGGGDCDQAIAHSLELSKATLSKMPGVDDKMLGKMHDVGVKSCREDKWPDDVIACMTDAKAMADAQGCYGKLSPAQQASMNKAAMELAAPAGAGSGSAAAPGSAAGSDTGSAGSGSAAAPGSDTAAGSAGSAAAK